MSVQQPPARSGSCELEFSSQFNVGNCNATSTEQDTHVVPAVINNLLPEGQTHFDGRAQVSWQVQQCCVTGLFNVNKETLIVHLKPFDVSDFEAPGAVDIYFTLPAGFDSDVSLVNRINHVGAGYFCLHHCRYSFDFAQQRTVLVNLLHEDMLARYPYSTLEMSAALGCRLGFRAPSTTDKSPVILSLTPLHFTQPLTINNGGPGKKYTIQTYHMPFNEPPTNPARLLRNLIQVECNDTFSLVWLGTDASRRARPLKKRLTRTDGDHGRLWAAKRSKMALYGAHVANLPDMACHIAPLPPNVNATMTHFTLTFDPACNITPRTPRKRPGRMVRENICSFFIGSERRLHPTSVLCLEPQQPHRPIALKGSSRMVQFVLKDAAGDVVSLAPSNGEVSICLLSDITYT